jgi:ribosomal protein L19E
VKPKAYNSRSFFLPAANKKITSAKLMKLLPALLATLLVLVPVPITSSGQSLGEVAQRARKEREAREKKGEVPVKVFTNDDIARMPPLAILKSSNQMSSSPQTQPTAPQEASTSSTQPGKSSSSSGNAKSPEKSKEYWQTRYKAARARLAHAKEEQKLVEDELRLLQIQQARDLNPDRSRQLNGQIDASTIELEVKRAATEKARQALEKVGKEFKDSGAPQDWIPKDSTASQ